MAQASFVVRALAMACLLALGACAAPAPAPALDRGASVTAFAAPGAPQRSCVRQGAGMATRGGSCRPLIDALQSQTGSLAYASDSGLRSAANSAPTPSDSCCSDLRTFVEQGCACDNSLLNVLPMVNSSPEAITTAVRVGQVTSCAAPWNGGSIYDPCTGSSGPGYYSNRRMAQ